MNFYAFVDLTGFDTKITSDTIVDKGVFSALTTYHRYDVASVSGRQYIALLTTTTTAPPHPGTWSLLIPLDPRQINAAINHGDLRLYDPDTGQWYTVSLSGTTPALTVNDQGGPVP